MVSQKLEYIKKQEEYEQTLDEVNKKNEKLHKKIRILEKEKINQLQEATQALRERDNSNIELQSQVKTLTKELKKNKELIKNLKEE